jgi:hypothetical protein
VLSWLVAALRLTAPADVSAWRGHAARSQGLGCGGVCTLLKALLNA